MHPLAGQLILCCNVLLNFDGHGRCHSRAGDRGPGNQKLLVPAGRATFGLHDSFHLGPAKCFDAIDEDDVDKYLAWLLFYNLGTVAMFFGIATYIVLHYRPTWEIFIVIQILTIVGSSKWLCDLWYLLFKGEAEYEAYREELLGDRRPEKDPDWLMHLLRFFRQLRSRKDKE